MWLFFKAALLLELQSLKKYRFLIFIQLFHLVVLLSLFFYISLMLDQSKTLDFEYFGFVTQGLAFSFLYQSFVNSSASYLHDWRMQGVLEPILQGPLSHWKIFLSIGWIGCLKAFLKSIGLLLLAAMVFNYSLSIYNGVLVFFSLLVIFFISQCLSLISVSSLLLWKRVNLVGVVSSLGLAILSGVYFPLSLLPEWLRIIGNFLPFRHGLEIFRYGLSGTPSEFGLKGNVIVCLSWAFLLLPLSIYFYQASEKKLLSQGGLNHL
ncbi:MAG: ABC transporter permease [Bdellovibrio sp.]|nr:MAG: ABC transporter permease [Bdellovibrio sp.]